MSDQQALGLLGVMAAPYSANPITGQSINNGSMALLAADNADRSRSQIIVNNVPQAQQVQVQQSQLEKVPLTTQVEYGEWRENKFYLIRALVIEIDPINKCRALVKHRKSK